jgi:hypothetical protein
MEHTAETSDDVRKLLSSESNGEHRRTPIRLTIALAASTARFQWTVRACHVRHRPEALTMEQTPMHPDIELTCAVPGVIHSPLFEKHVGEDAAGRLCADA